MMKKILLVDDDQNILSAYERLSGKKFTVATVNSACEGIAALRERDPFAVLVSDYRMPIMDGISFFSLARQIAPTGRRILLTGHADPEGAISAINEGHVFRLLTKPCPGDVLLDNVTAAAEQYRLNAEREEADKTLRYKLTKMTGEFKNTFKNTIQSINLLIEKRDPYTACHQRKVAYLAVALARGMGLAEEQIEGLKMAAMVHDIGKIYVPAAILNKPGKLNKIEFSLVKNHPQVGYEILQLINFPWPAKEIVLQHHERLNGSGYPQGLKGEEILFAARILSVADVVEAMLSLRPYKRAFALNETLDEISQNAGILYDEKVVDTCLTLFKTKAFVLQVSNLLK